jgi:hypothetical protein
MSFASIEAKNGKSADDFKALAEAKAFVHGQENESIKADDVVNGIKQDFGPRSVCGRRVSLFKPSRAALRVETTRNES